MTRRWFLKSLAGVGAATTVSARAAWPEIFARSFAPGLAQAVADAKPVFEQIPPSATGISWVHSNGRSDEMYLPETVGAGCAFLDYDNDGWMDIYLVNSGKCDFFNPDPPLRNALYKNNRDGTFTDVTTKAGVAGNAYGMGVAVGDYDGDGFPDSTSRSTRRAFSITTTATERSLTSPPKPASLRTAGAPAPSGSTTIMTVASISSSAASSTSTNPKTNSAAISRRTSAGIASPASTIRCRVGSITIMATELSPM